MTIKDYKCNFINGDRSNTRHIYNVNDKEYVLCGKSNESAYLEFSLENQVERELFILCPECISALPDTLSEEVKFKYIVNKLKGRI